MVKPEEVTEIDTMIEIVTVAVEVAVVITMTSEFSIEYEQVAGALCSH